MENFYPPLLRHLLLDRLGEWLPNGGGFSDEIGNPFNQVLPQK
jgi:hypothetical protein